MIMYVFLNDASVHYYLCSLFLSAVDRRSVNNLANVLYSLIAIPFEY